MVSVSSSRPLARPASPSAKRTFCGAFRPASCHVCTHPQHSPPLTVPVSKTLTRSAHVRRVRRAPGAALAAAPDRTVENKTSAGADALRYRESLFSLQLRATKGAHEPLEQSVLPNELSNFFVEHRVVGIVFLATAFLIAIGILYHFYFSIEIHHTQYKNARRVREKDTALPMLT